MADINIERKKGAPWIWWLLGLLLLALLIWGISELLDDDEPEVAAVPAATVPVAEPVATAAAPAGLTIAEVLANPGAYAGQPFSTGQVQVAQVVSDRGFWIESNGQRLFVVKNESPETGVADVQGPPDTRAARNINAGETVQINGTLYTTPDQLQPPLDEQTRQALQGQPIVLQANVSEIQHVAAP
ncbi:MAG: hypothetical protein KY467_11900 [Gemmatimonadetes bacterium]|nr:hypothetical protein [Gemmatimonadota bacterium]